MDKKQERNLTIAVIILIIILLLIIALPILLRLPYHYTYEGVNGIEYNFTVDRHTGKPIHILSFWVDYNTVNEGNGVPGFSKEYLVPFEYNPEELEDISLDKDIKYLIFDKDKTRTIYITRNPILGIETKGKSEIGILTILRITGREMDPAAFKIETISAVTEEIDPSSDIPVITCNDSGKNGRTVIFLERGEENRIYMDENNCVILEFVKDDDAIAVSTKLVYHLIGLM